MKVLSINKDAQERERDVPKRLGLRKRWLLSIIKSELFDGWLKHLCLYINMYIILTLINKIYFVKVTLVAFSYVIEDIRIKKNI